MSVFKIITCNIFLNIFAGGSGEYDSRVKCSYMLSSFAFSLGYLDTCTAECECLGFFFFYLEDQTMLIEVH